MQLPFLDNIVDALIEHHVSTYTRPSSGVLNKLKTQGYSKWLSGF